MFERGVQKVQSASGDARRFYTVYTTTNLYVEVAFGFPAFRVVVVNDAANMEIIDISFDGATLDGSLKPGEDHDFFVNGQDSVFIKAQSGTPDVRVWAE